MLSLPSYRFDLVDVEDDLVEEVAREYMATTMLFRRVRLLAKRRFAALLETTVDLQRVAKHSGCTRLPGSHHLQFC